MLPKEKRKGVIKRMRLFFFFLGHTGTSTDGTQGPRLN